MTQQCAPGPRHAVVALSMKICRTLRVVHGGTVISA